MDHRIETIKKNHEERMGEFVNILNRDDCLPGCKVLDEWRFHLELTLKKFGWVAVYKPMKGRKQLLPCMEMINEVVMVDKVEFHNFEANVIGTEQTETLSSSSGASSAVSSKVFCVPLEDLYPCINQPDPQVDGIEIANILDQLRFFRVNLWLPWDEEDDSEDWRISCLEPRLQLLYDMDQGLVTCEVSERVKRLWRQAWEIHDTLQTLEVSIDDDGSVVPVEAQAEEEEGLVIRIMQLHLRLDSVKSELERLQNPLIRNLMVREKQRMVRRSGKGGEAWSRLVWGGGSTLSLGSFVSEASVASGSDKNFKIYPLLPMALEEANAGDFVFLGSGNVYTVTGSAGLESGGSIRGLGKEMARVSGCEAGDVMLNVKCEPCSSEPMEDDSSSLSSSSPAFSFSLSNLHLEAYNMEICLLLNSGNILLENCVIDGGGSHNKDDSVGVMLREGASLVARNCIFTGFTSAIIAYDKSQLELVRCQIKNCETGMQLYKGARMVMDNCSVSECTSHGIYYKWSSFVPELRDKVMAQELLNSLPGVSVSETDFQAVSLVVQNAEGSPNSSIASICL